MQQASPDRRGARLRALLVFVAALVTVALTASLGRWQLDRAEQKRALQKERSAASALPPVSVQSVVENPKTPWDQRTVRWQGEWLLSKSVWLDNRPMNQRSGFLLLTPLRLNTGDLIWVQRGWQAKGAGVHSAPPWPMTATGRVEVEGRLAPQASRAYDLGPAASGVLKQNLDLAASERELGRAPLPWVLWQTANCSPLDCNWPAPDDGVAKHHGYAVQWFALSALTLGLYVWFQVFLPVRRRNARA